MRKTLAMLVGMLALVVGVAPAQAHHTFGHTAVEVVDTATGTPCPELSVSGNTVTGGCLVEDVIGTFSTETDSYDVETDLRVDAEGNLYAVNPYIYPGQQYAQRRACTEGTDVVPWYSEAPIGILFGSPPLFHLNMCAESTFQGSHFWDKVAYEISGDEPGDLGVVTGFEQSGTSEKDAIKWSAYTVYGGEISIQKQ